jgi:hypothetical protein
MYRNLAASAQGMLAAAGSGTFNGRELHLARGDNETVDVIEISGRLVEYTVVQSAAPFAKRL